MRLLILAFGLTVALLGIFASLTVTAPLDYASQRLSCYGVAVNGNDFLPGAECTPRAR